MFSQRYAVVVFLFSALIAGCSGGGSSSPGPSDNVTPTPVPTATAKPTATPTPFSTGPVTVNVSSSTNTQAYTIVLQQNATAVVTQDNATEAPVSVPTADSNQFFKDLNADSPVDDVATYPNCAKSSSFGTTTTLMYGGYSTNDISCPGPSGSAVDTLYDDEQKIKDDIAAANPNAFGN